MNNCHHPHEHQQVGINNTLREIHHTCTLCGHIDVSTLGTVHSTIPKDLWLDLTRPGGTV